MLCALIACHELANTCFQVLRRRFTGIEMLISPRPLVHMLRLWKGIQIKAATHLWQIIIVIIILHVLL